MARTQITVQDVGPFGTGIDTVTWTNVDQANGMYFVNDGRTMLWFQNRNVSSRTATIHSVADPFGRTGDKTVTTAGATGSPLANVNSAYGPFRSDLFNQLTPAGTVNVDFSASTDYYVAAVRLNSP